jgi:hypothetical protein
VRLLLCTVVLVLAAALPAASQREIPPVPFTEIEHSLERLGQPVGDAHRLVERAQAGRIQKADLSLLAAVIRQYESLTVQFCRGTSAGEISPDWCSKDSYPYLEALSRGNIALHHVTDKAKIPGWTWRYSKDPDLWWPQWFQNKTAWGYRYGYYYPAFPKD